MNRKNWIADHPVRWKEYLDGRRQVAKNFVLAAKQKPCMDCKQTFKPWQMDFDHVRGKKLMDIGHVGQSSTARIQRELDKCELVCANCHRDRTHNRGEYRFYERKN